MTFRILASQMEALGAQTREDFVLRMQAYFEAHMGEFVGRIGDDALAAWLDRGVAFAHARNITTEPEVAQLLLLKSELGESMEAPWAEQILADRQLLAHAKVRRLVMAGLQHAPELMSVVAYPQFRPDVEEEDRA